MGLRIDLPSADLLGIAGVVVNEITTDTTLLPGQIYVLGGTTGGTLTFPDLDAVNDGAEIVLKRVSTADPTWTTNTTLFDGTSSTLEITNNQPIRLLFISTLFGWLIT